MTTAKLTPSIVHTFCLCTALFLSINSHADEYYKWIGENGDIVYGSNPPPGVQATLVTTYNDSNLTSEEAKKAIEEADKIKQAAEQRKQHCAEEKERLSALRTSGTRVRMQLPDGSIKYLTQEEVDSEIEMSEGFIKNNCD